MKELMDLMKKKKEKSGEMSPERKSSKMKVLGELRGIANDAIGKDIPGLKKVTVASPSKQGLAEGLDVAEEMVEGDTSANEENPMDGISDMEAMDEAEPDMLEQAAYQRACEAAETLSPEEKKKLIAKLSAE